MNLLLSARAQAIVALVALMMLLVTSTAAVAQGGSDVITALQNGNAYVSPLLHSPQVHAGDLRRLEATVTRATSQGVPEKLAIIHSFPSYDHNTAGAAHDIRNTLGFSGVVVVVSPSGIGLSSDKLSQSELDSIAVKARPRCLAQSFTACAIFAGQQAVTQVKADQSSSSGSTSTIWIVVAALLLGVLAFSVVGARRRGGARQSRLSDLRRAAENTLSQADAAVLAVESEIQTGHSLPAAARADYDRALGLRDTARTELERVQSPEMLTQANQDAAHAVLGLQGVMRAAGIPTPLNNPLEAPMHRCFYCGRTDRPPYTTRTIEDGRGNSMDVEVCAVDEARLGQGQRPEVATATYGGSQVPWYAVPGNPWYYAYGGPTWQYWMPLLLGVELGSLVGGGWGWGGPVFGGNWDNGGWNQGSGWDGGAQVPTDAGGADFGGGGWDPGGGWGNSGGADFGGGDSGGGDFGGGDWGGGGDSGGWS